MEKDHLPRVSLYSKYLNIASIRFNLSLYECRDKFGLYTNSQWLKLFDDHIKTLWEQLGDIPINDNDEIDEKFLDFPKGTDRFEIWHWFEETFNVSVAKDLMGLP